MTRTAVVGAIAVSLLSLYSALALAQSARFITQGISDGVYLAAADVNGGAVRIAASVSD